MEANVKATLAYLLTPFTGIYFFVVEKQDKFVRFHAFQSALFGLVAFGAWSIAQSLKIILIGFILAPLVSFSAALLWFFLMWKAYNKVEFELPVLGKIAKEQANKKS